MTASSFLRASLVSVALLLVGGCGVRRVPDGIVDRLPYEARIELLEAENDLAVAVDRLDEASNEVSRTRALIKRSKDRLKAANGEVSSASDALSKEVAELAVTEGAARVEYLKAKEDVNKMDENLASLFLRCAYARFEQSRMLAARKAKLEGSESLDPVAFDNDVKACDAKHAEAKAAMKETETQAATLRSSWDATKEKLAKKTFDARASPYVE